MVKRSDVALRGTTALVTGASSGLGADFARRLAARGCNLILVARREELLRTLREELTGRYGVDVVIVPRDLGAPDAPQALYDQIKDAGYTVDVLVNNAGFGIFGRFTEIPWERERQLLELDIIALVQMTKLFVNDMVARRFGFVLQLASIGAYQPTPLYASYAAAKSFVLSFGEALNYELRGTGVSCTVLSPGITATEFLTVTGQQATLYQRLVMMESADVTRIGIEALLDRRPSVVPGRLNAIAAWSNRLLPRRAVTALAYQLMKN